ncbi:hypothetical protein PAPYR_9145 [Paratrimastix pyriformis]|uniref:Uncharacterized protein n=1 Tax=Paratrimastix pyriformis TaxID=342808 RepID=A0ABQ8UGB4_9EUKA|nr:hypothetical protein PAPYR_9145 [Paratrimastix pyriformis]
MPRKALRNFVRRAAAAVTRLPRHSRDDSSEEEPRGHSRKRARAEPKSSAADAAPASPLRLDTVTEDEAEQEGDNAPARNTRRPNRNKRRPNMPARMPINITQSTLRTQAQSELQQTGTEPEAAEQSVPGEPEQLAEPEQPAEPELTPEPEQTAAPPPTPLKAAPPTPDRLRRRRLPSSETEGGLPGYQEVRSRSPTSILATQRSPPPAAGSIVALKASASGILPEPHVAPCRVLRLTCSPGHRHEHYRLQQWLRVGLPCLPEPHVQPRSPPRATASLQQWLRVGLPCLPEPHVQPRSPPRARLQSLQQWLRIELPCLPERPHRHEFTSVPPTTESSASVVVEHRPPAPQSDLPRLAIGDKGSVETHSTGILRTDLSQAAGKLVFEHKPSESRSHRPCSFFETMAEYRLSGAICVELHKVLNRLGLTFGKILFSMTCGQSADIEKTYQFLTSRALMILVCLDSEAAFGVDRAVDGHMRLEELALWERTFPFYVKEFPKVFQACEREYLALSEDERKTYDWSIQCHKFRTNTCYREIPAHWDCLFKFTGSA